MTLQANYPSKKELKANIGQPLRYIETSVFGREYRSDGNIMVCNEKRSWFATVSMENNIIIRVV